ncbi:glycosyltransferase family 2 protein [Verrucomicrobiales bacterium]|nr:glycosyltransferase family 2 protein [Verrucomicrobiales bacterium]
MPSQDRSDMLREAIDSVLRLDLLSVEVIVCDDGSSEDLAAVCDCYIESGIRVIWSSTKESFGAQVARNRGLALAKGEFVLFLDSDDVLADKGLESLLLALDQDSFLAYAYGKVIQTDADLKPIPGRDPVGSPFHGVPPDIAGYHWHTMGAVYRRAFLERVGRWNESLTGSQDWEYQARVKIAKGRGVFVDSVVGYWRQHAGVRVGAAKFRPDYVRSVMLACEAILAKARNAGLCNYDLETRLAKKLVVHALEWGANGCLDERGECFEQAAKCMVDGGSFATAIRTWSRLPAWADASLLKLFTKH